MNTRALSILLLSIVTILFIASIPEMQAQDNCEALRQEKRKVVKKIREIDPIYEAARGQEKERLKAEYQKLDTVLLKINEKLKDCPPQPPPGPQNGINPVVIAAIITAIGAIIVALIGLLRRR